MPIVIKPTDTKEFTKLKCPRCGHRVKGVGLLKESRINGLTFICTECKNTWEITTT